MEDIFARIWENLADRVSGPMWLRLIIQPSVAIFFAARDGLKDLRAGRPPYLWRVLTQQEHRRDLIRDAWTSIAKVFTMALIADGIYQLIVQRWIYPFEIIIIAFLLAIVPYLLIRGPLNRLIRRFGTSKAKGAKVDG